MGSSQRKETVLNKYQRDKMKQKLRMRKFRENQSQEEKILEKERRNGRMRKLREEQSPAEKKIENEKVKESMRKLRDKKKRLRDNVYSSSTTSLLENEDIVSKLNKNHRQEKPQQVNLKLEMREREKDSEKKNSENIKSNESIEKIRQNVTKGKKPIHENDDFFNKSVESKAFLKRMKPVIVDKIANLTKTKLK